jgi:cell division protein FtsB
MMARRTILLLFAVFVPFVAGGGNCAPSRQMREEMLGAKIRRLEDDNEQLRADQQFLEDRVKGLEEAYLQRPKVMKE